MGFLNCYVTIVLELGKGCNFRERIVIFFLHAQSRNFIDKGIYKCIYIQNEKDSHIILL
jgi:hypothetical protein